MSQVLQGKVVKSAKKKKKERESFKKTAYFFHQKLNSVFKKNCIRALKALQICGCTVKMHVCHV